MEDIELLKEKELLLIKGGYWQYSEEDDEWYWVEEYGYDGFNS